MNPDCHGTIICAQQNPGCRGPVLSECICPPGRHRRHGPVYTLCPPCREYCEPPRNLPADPFLRYWLAAMERAYAREMGTSMEESA